LLPGDRRRTAAGTHANRRAEPPSAGAFDPSSSTARCRERLAQHRPEPVPAMWGCRTVIQCVEVSKYFGAVRALDHVSIDLPVGSVTCLVGDNGAGKSTLVKILAGIHQPDRGFVEVDGVEHDHLTPRKARDLGIQTVHQHLALCDNLGAAANVTLGQEPTKLRLGPFKFIDRAAAELAARKLINQSVGISIPNYEVPIHRFSGGQRQAVAIARALVSAHRLIMFDEPTAALGVRQTEATLKLVRRVAEQGVAVLMISHNLDDIMAVADRVVALRLGRVTLTKSMKDTSRAEVVGAMTGLEMAGGSQ
jgi:ABC-type sugar transport system ATPase subunit